MKKLTDSCGYVGYTLQSGVMLNSKPVLFCMSPLPNYFHFKRYNDVCDDMFECATDDKNKWMHWFDSMNWGWLNEGQ